jgi:hypothetical protein
MKQPETKPTLIPQPKAYFTLEHLSKFLEASNQWCPSFSSQQEFNKWAMQQPREAAEAYGAKSSSMLQFAINTVKKEIEAKLQPLKDANIEVGKKCEDALHSCADETVVEISNDPTGTRRVDKHYFRHHKISHNNLVDSDPYKEFMELVEKHQKDHEKKVKELLTEKVEITPVFASEIGVDFKLFPKENNPFREICKGIVIPADVPMEITK